MISLKANARKEKGKIFRSKDEAGFIPAVLYGPGIETISLKVNKKDFEKVYNEVGETLIDFDVDGKNYSVLVHDTQSDPLTSELIHVDFYQPNLTEEVEADVEIEIIGEAQALKLGGTLITNMRELTVSALPKDLPSEIIIDVSSLNTFDDVIMIKDISLPKGVTIVGRPEEIVVKVMEPENVDEELAKPIEDVSKEPEKAGEKKEEEVVQEEDNK
ncbi:MAG: 50S ribosomal protein L25 [Candidatus Pacebacteria bacterium]|nr:50S ribosomal protein L25 [Candidatus Paceibacterota bacterium]